MAKTHYRAFRSFPQCSAGRSSAMQSCKEPARCQHSGISSTCVRSGYPPPKATRLVATHAEVHKSLPVRPWRCIGRRVPSRQSYHRICPVLCSARGTAMQCGAAQPTEGFAGLGIGAVQYASEGPKDPKYLI